MCASALLGLRLLESHFVEETVEHVSEPLKNTYSIYLENECVFLIGVSFKLGAGLNTNEKKGSVEIEKLRKKLKMESQSSSIISKNIRRVCSSAVWEESTLKLFFS